MTEPGSLDPFDTRFADRVRAYTNPATARPIDSLRIARAAMSSRRAPGRSADGLGAGFLRPRTGGVRWAAAAAVVLIGVVAIAVIGGPPEFGIGPQPTPAISSTPNPAASADEQVPDFLRHSWQRPYAVTPDLDQWPTGFLSLAIGTADFGPAPGTAASRSAVTAVGIDTLVFAATAETRGCAIGAIGAYRWSIAGEGTVMTLAAVDADACAARQEALAGEWVRSDLPIARGGGAPLPPGTDLTSAFDPFGDPGAPGRLSYTVPQGWRLEEDQPTRLFLHYLPDTSPSQPSTDSFIFLFTEPRLAADAVLGTSCGPSSEAPGVGHRVDDIAAALIARPGVVATPPATVTIGGYDGRLLDLKLAPSWTGGCQAPEGHIVGVPILVAAGAEAGPSVGIGPNHPLRLILLDLSGGRTMSIAIFNPEPSEAASFDAHVTAVMPIIESFQFIVSAR